RPFYKSLVEFMISGPVIVQVLEGDNAVQKNRDVMGATDPAKAGAGTIRKDFAESIEANSVHGSDSTENAAQEIAFFFSESEICPKQNRTRAPPGAAEKSGEQPDRSPDRSPARMLSPPPRHRRCARAIRRARPSTVDNRATVDPRLPRRARRDPP